MKKQTMFSMRLNQDMKMVLEDLARAERRTLSSLVESILADYLTENQIEWECHERRGYSRKVIEMPARFQVPGHKDSEEHYVYLKDISQTGAYAISTDVIGIEEKILKEQGISIKAKLIIPIPDRKEPLALDCEVVRISIDRNLTGIGLEYRNIQDRQQSVINETLLTKKPSNFLI